MSNVVTVCMLKVLMLKYRKEVPKLAQNLAPTPLDSIDSIVLLSFQMYTVSVEEWLMNVTDCCFIIIIIRWHARRRA